MQSVTAMAHLRACVLFFMDLSEQCGYSVADQIKLYHSIKALFVNKPTLLVINKIDARRPEDLNEEDKALLEEITVKERIEMVQLSCFTEEGVMNVRDKVGFIKNINIFERLVIHFWQLELSTR